MEDIDNCVVDGMTTYNNNNNNNNNNNSNNSSNNNNNNSSKSKENSKQSKDDVLQTLKTRSPSPLAEVVFTNTTPHKSLLTIPIPLSSSMTQLIKDVKSNLSKSKRTKRNKDNQRNSNNNDIDDNEDDDEEEDDDDDDLVTSLSSSPNTPSVISDTDENGHSHENQVVPNQTGATSDCLSPFEYDHTTNTKHPLISPLICSPKFKSIIDSSIDENELSSIFKIQQLNNNSSNTNGSNASSINSNSNSNSNGSSSISNSSSNNSNSNGNKCNNSINGVNNSGISTPIKTSSSQSSSSLLSGNSNVEIIETTPIRSRNNSFSGNGRQTPSRLNKDRNASPIPFVLPTTTTTTTSANSTSTTDIDTPSSSSNIDNSNSSTVESNSIAMAMSKVRKDRWSFSAYITDEIHGDYMPINVDDTMKREQVYNFVHVPWELEKLLSFGFLICLENFLYLFTFLPIRIVFTFLKLLALPFSKKYRLTNTQVYDIFRTFIWIISFAFLNLVDSSMVYHHIRGQAVIKLYIIYNVLEVLDKLCCSFGQDIFDSLYWMSVSLRGSQTNSTTTGSSSSSSTAKSTSSSSSSSSSSTPSKSTSTTATVPPPPFSSKFQQMGSGQILAPFQHIIVCTIYVCLHSLILFTQVITLNVAINSYNNSLLTLIMSNNFVELKGSVFKRFEKENLFQISCSDIVERFQIFIYLAIIFFQNLSDLNWDLSGDFILNMIGVIVSVWGSEVIVDAIKHAFITKFNKISPTIYGKFRTHLIDTILDTRNKSFSESSWSITSVIGFIPFPLATVVNLEKEAEDEGLPLLPSSATAAAATSTSKNKKTTTSSRNTKAAAKTKTTKNNKKNNKQDKMDIDGSDDDESEEEADDDEDDDDEDDSPPPPKQSRSKKAAAPAKPTTTFILK
ncbi:DUF747 family protein [Heterostelium album PN500]|uniref:DUF747 family protein n=1 Tax=Heterostelium pallidum (strain ATCC 26659 / Pp 5 / PN500) TaxID=670386 RepID=D3BE11_HETP5|nr:DUF747 family protein [Heterostelium album PN500]EFA80142.1 DUF747 family protein [Heterostelium album PN500]|eukprot:XP_020432262.1 DUF747 family protein [Heterostelium album PN500]